MPEAVCIFPDACVPTSIQRGRKHGGCAFGIRQFRTRQEMGVIVNACGGSICGGLGYSISIALCRLNAETSPGTLFLAISVPLVFRPVWRK